MIETRTTEGSAMKRRCVTALVAVCCFGSLAGSTQAANPAPAPATQPSVVATAPVRQLVASAAPEQPAPAAVATPAVSAPDPTNAAASAPEPIVIDYSEADIQSVLRTLAAKAGVNLILGDEVMGKVTVHLENVTYEEAMQLIAESKGFAYIKDNNVVRVKSRESIEVEPVEMRLLTLHYAKADDLKKTVDPVLSKQGKMEVDERSNTLIISDTPSNLAKLIPLLQSLDTQTQQVMIEARFVETTKNPTKDLGINWANTLLDHSVTLGSPPATTGSGGSSSGSSGGPVASDFSFSKGLRPGSTWLPTTAFLDVGQANAVFSYLSQDTDSQLLANPRIVTTDNGKAKISIATQFPIPQFAFSEQTGTFQISGFDYKDIGIILTVTPRVNQNDYVTLDVTPEASSSTQNATLNSGTGNSVQIPIIDTRTATTTVLIKSGHTLAIGGLMRIDTSDVYSKVPLMGDLPGLGALFRSKSLSKTKRDLIIFLTPTIVGPESRTGYEKYANGLPNEQVYTDDTWLPHDNAKPQSIWRDVTGKGGGALEPAPTPVN